MFRPTVAPPGRLVRLSVVLDTRNEPRRLAQIASMCDRAGIDALWVRDSLVAGDDAPRQEAWTSLTIAAGECRRARLGAMVRAGLRTPALLSAMAGTLDELLEGRLELGISSRLDDLEPYAAQLRDQLTVREGNRVPPLSIEAATPKEAQVAARLADNVLIPAGAMTDAGLAAAEVRKACEVVARDPRTLGVSVELPVSVGRSSAEALARAEAEPLFQLLVRRVQNGIIGRLEECQDRVVQLAHAGITDLLCILPNTPDIHDVIAQLTAMVVGNVQVHTPGAPRSKAPDPPDAWGGRYNPQSPTSEPR